MLFDRCWRTGDSVIYLALNYDDAVGYLLRDSPVVGLPESGGSVRAREMLRHASSSVSFGR